MQSFAIVAHRRTGSNHLVTLLNSHPNLRCYGEVFRNLYNFERFLPEVEPAIASHEFGQIEPLAFLDAIGRQVPRDNSAWGFKLMPFQIEHAVGSIINEKLDRVIVLRRNNLLAQYSSELIADKTGQSVAGRNAEVKTAKVRFKSRAFELFSKRVSAHYDLVSDILKDSGKSALHIEYLELQDEDLVARLCSFLEVENLSLKSGHKKRNSTSIVDRFENVARVRKYLEDNQLEHWADESR